MASGRRRRWTAAEKARIVEASFGPGGSVSVVAERYGIHPNQVYGWRRILGWEQGRRWSRDGSWNRLRPGCG